MKLRADLLATVFSITTLLCVARSSPSAAQTITGDCSGSGSGTIPVTCTMTNGVAFAPSATIDTTNGSNISSGTIPAGRLLALENYTWPSTNSVTSRYGDGTNYCPLGGPCVYSQQQNIYTGYAARGVGNQTMGQFVDFTDAGEGTNGPLQGAYAFGAYAEKQNWSTNQQALEGEIGVLNLNTRNRFGDDSLLIGTAQTVGGFATASETQTQITDANNAYIQEVGIQIGSIDGGEFPGGFVTGVSSSGSTATLAFNAASDLAVGDTISVTGSNNPNYNGAFFVTGVTESGSTHTATYSCSTTCGTAPTSSILVRAFLGSVQGFETDKKIGNGGDAIYVQSESGASWTNTLNTFNGSVAIRYSDGRFTSTGGIYWQPEASTSTLTPGQAVVEATSAIKATYKYADSSGTTRTLALPLAPSGTQNSLGEWISFTPTFSASTGQMASSQSGFFTQVGKTVSFTETITVGTATGSGVSLVLPVPADNSIVQFCEGREADNGVQLQGVVDGPDMGLVTYSNANPNTAVGAIYIMSCTYKAQ